MNEYMLVYRVWGFEKVHAATASGGSAFRPLTTPVDDVSRQRGLLRCNESALTAADAIVQANVRLAEELRRACGEYPTPELVEIETLR